MTTFTGQVSASGRDAQQASVGVAAVINDTSLQTAGRLYWGIAFLNVTIAQGSFIGRAVIETYGYTKYPTMATTIYGEAANNATVYTTGTNNLSNRTKTTANVAHSTTYTADGWQSTPDLRAVIQEIVNRASFASGNAISTLWVNTTTGFGATATAYDGVAANAPKITIDYYAGQGSAVTGLAIATLLGSPTVTPGAVTASVTGLAITVAFGAPTATPGAVTASVTGLAIATTFGTPTVSQSGGQQTADVTGLESTTVLGSPTVTPGAITSTVDGLAITTSLGTPTTTAGTVTATVTGIAISLQLGSLTAALLPQAREVTYIAFAPTRRWQSNNAHDRWTPLATDHRWISKGPTR